MNKELGHSLEQVILAVNGDFQGKNAAEIRDRLSACLLNGQQNIVVDLNATSAINATGLGVLVSIQRQIEQLGGQLTLRGVGESLREIFIRTRLNRYFVMK